MECCEMKGHLSYLILWIINKKSMNGSEISKELEIRRGTKPSPGTVYPAIKELNKKGLISADKNKSYSLTEKGKKELHSSCKSFCKMFYDIHEMIHNSKK
jgi:PadR family transcriptional regulator, regulatory protein PadR